MPVPTSWGKAECKAPCTEIAPLRADHGIDLGFTGEAVMKWAVLAKSWDNYKAGSLAGKYGGVGAEVTAALGVGTNVLGSTTWKECVLQPISISGQTGLNIAAGIAELELQPATK